MQLMNSGGLCLILAILCRKSLIMQLMNSRGLCLLLAIVFRESVILRLCLFYVRKVCDHATDK